MYPFDCRKEPAAAVTHEDLSPEAQIEEFAKYLVTLQSELNMACLAAVAAYSLAAQTVRGDCSLVYYNVTYNEL